MYIYIYREREGYMLLSSVVSVSSTLKQKYNAAILGHDSIH